MITREQIERSLLEIISRRKNQTIDKAPDGWVTVAQAAGIARMSKCRMRLYLREAHKAGEVQKKVFRVMCGAGPRPVPHYFLGSK